MALISLPTFSGEVPRTSPRLLENTQASVAMNCSLERGALEAMAGPGFTASLPAGSVRRTIFKHDVDGWLSWTGIVHVVKSAVLDIDGEKPLGHIFLTGERAYPTQRFAGGATYRLGIPRPTSAPTVNIAVKKNVLAYAWGADTTTQIPPRTGYEDALKAIQNDTATVAAIADTDISTAGIGRTSVYCYTLVQSLANGVWQQESAPSPVAGPIDVLEGCAVKISGFVIPNLPGLTVTHIRIYRAVAGTSTVEYQFLAEIPASQTTYVDSTNDEDMSGDTLETLYWDAIPDDAKGLIKTDNGIYAAFRGNEVLLSEPFVPYAFPEKYRNTVEDSIVALGHTDNTIIVLTTGRPYLITGSEPENMQFTHLPIEQSCVSAQSVAMIAGGVIYASPDGLMLFTSKEQSLITGEIWTREQWRALSPETLLGTVHDGKYIGFFAGTGKGFSLNIGAKDIVNIQLPNSLKVYAVYHHSADDCVYISTKVSDNAVYELEAGSAMTYRWRSKPFWTSALTCMSAARVEAEYGSGTVQMNVFGPDTSKARQTLTLKDARVKRLTTTRSETLWSVELSGTTPVFDVRIGGSVEEVVHGQ